MNARDMQPGRSGEATNDTAYAGTGSGYRNLFGDAAPPERYVGFGTDVCGRSRNRRMLRWLSKCLGRPYRWPDDGGPDNRRIPAGYTYFAQFVIHDTIQTLGDLSDLRGRPAWMRNGRSGRLVLDALYGGGPNAAPLLYAASASGPGSGGPLRLGGSACAPALLRDLPRSPCPYAGRPANADVLIADARNDDNVLVAQVTVLFHLFHNIVYDALHGRHPRYSEARIFALARLVVTRVYRNIVVGDLLERLLLPQVYRKYLTQQERAFADSDDPRMPLEFSHAAARVGHFMVRDAYKINAALDGTATSIRSIVRQTSASQPWEMPLAPRWLVDWATLFDKPGTTALRARRFGPAISPTLAVDELFGDPDDPIRGDGGGLVYRDLRRGAETGLRSVASLVAKLPEHVRALSPLVLSDGSIDGNEIVAWLRSGPPPETGKDRETYIRCIERDMPLLLFLLIEAAVTSAPSIRPGECLGAIGSFILAEFFFREYWRTYPVIEADAEARDEEAALFGGAAPGSMPQLIGEIAHRKNWEDVQPKFW